MKRLCFFSCWTAVTSGEEASVHPTSSWRRNKESFFLETLKYMDLFLFLDSLTHIFRDFQEIFKNFFSSLELESES